MDQPCNSHSKDQRVQRHILKLATEPIMCICFKESIEAFGLTVGNERRGRCLRTT